MEQLKWGPPVLSSLMEPVQYMQGDPMRLVSWSVSTLWSLFFLSGKFAVSTKYSS